MFKYLCKVCFCSLFESFKRWSFRGWCFCVRADGVTTRNLPGWTRLAGVCVQWGLLCHIFVWRRMRRGCRKGKRGPLSQREVSCLTSGPWMGAPNQHKSYTLIMLHPTEFKGKPVCNMYSVSQVSSLVWSGLQINLAKNSPHRQEENIWLFCFIALYLGDIWKPMIPQ